MNELISVIVTSYNHAEYLKQRLDTILNQTYKNREIIVIDDFSTDSSRDVLSRYKDVPGLRLVFLEKNMGYAHTCNYGVSFSCGEYIMLAECDDFNEHRHLEILYNKIKESDEIGVVYSRSNIVDGSGMVVGDDFQNRIMSFKRYCMKDTLISRQKMQRFLITSCVIPNMSAALFRKRYFNIIHGFSGSFKVCADWDFWCRMAEVCDFYYVATALNNFRRHATTVREVFGLESQFSEISVLLQNSASKINLTKIEQLKFKINLGHTFAYESLFSCKNGIKCFLGVLRCGFKFGKLFFLLGLISGCVELFYYKMKVILNSSIGE